MSSDLAPSSSDLLVKPGFEPPLEMLLNEVTLGVVQLSREGDVLHANAMSRALIDGPAGNEILQTLREMTSRCLEVGDFVEAVLSLGAIGEVRCLVSPARCLDGCLAVLERGVVPRLRAETTALRAMLAAASDAASPTEAAHRALSTLASTLKGSYLVLYEHDGGTVRALAHVGVPGPHAAVLAARKASDRTWLVGRVLETGRAHHVAHLGRSFFPAERALPGAERLAALGLPVRGRGVTLGVLFVCGPRDLLGEGELKLTQGLADALGALVDRARQDTALKTLVDHLPDAVIEIDAAGQISGAGGRLVGILGRGADALIDTPIAELLDPADRTRFAALCSAAADGPTTGEIAIFLPNGGRVPCEVSAHVSRSDGTVRTIFRDVSARLALQQQVEESQQRAIRSDRLAAIGTLAAGVAHEINNPLAFVKSNVTVQAELFGELRQALAGGPQAVHDLINELEEIGSETGSGIERIATIVKQLKMQAREAGSEVVTCDVAVAVREAVHVFARAKGRDDAVDCQLPAGLPRIGIDSGKLGQVILNLLENGLDAMGNVGTLCVRAVAEAHSVRITVADRGTGIPMHVRERIFEPFFTTKGVGKGTGLGLHISHQLVTQAGGTLGFETGPTGTTFAVDLPRAA